MGGSPDRDVRRLDNRTCHEDLFSCPNFGGCRGTPSRHRVTIAKSYDWFSPEGIQPNMNGDILIASDLDRQNVNLDDDRDS